MRKRRTRSHIIADLSANHFERHALLCGYSMERITHDYGIDSLLYTYTDEGEIENECVRIQFKATDHLLRHQGGETIAFPVERSDLEHWLAERFPVILIVYDAQTDAAYWVYVQAYFQRQAGFDLALAGETVTVSIRLTNCVDTAAIRQFARFKARLLNQTEGVTHDEG